MAKRSVRTKTKISKSKTIKKSSSLKTKKVKKTKKANIVDSLLELLRVTSTVIPKDVQAVVLDALNREEKNTSAGYAMDIIKKNIEIAKSKSQPLCQDTGTVIVYVGYPCGYSTVEFGKKFFSAVKLATKKGYLRENSVDSITGKSEPTNIGPGHPYIYFHEHKKKHLEVKVMLKGGGCENVSTQYSLPYNELDAGRDLKGVRKVILDAVYKAQGQGCGPGVLGVCIGGDRAIGASKAKAQLLRKLDDTSPHKQLRDLEEDIVKTANELGIGPMGFGGKTTLLGCKIDFLNRVPASFFVSISYMCWAFRRQGIELDIKTGSIKKWLY